MKNNILEVAKFSQDFTGDNGTKQSINFMIFQDDDGVRLLLDISSGRDLEIHTSIPITDGSSFGLKKIFEKCHSLNIKRNLDVEYVEARIYSEDEEGKMSEDVNIYNNGY